jgi:phosphatidylserine/phosphatidylglycerophosphate/cardiolipin synthase-like enzyme
MRNVVTQNGLIVKAYAGATGVLLAFNFEADASRIGLLGFAIQRKGPVDATSFLDSMLPFKGQAHQPGEPIPSNQAPIQKFRWSDYTVTPVTTYTYTVSAMYGTPTQLVTKSSASISITTETTDATTVFGNPQNLIAVFNRAVASSQAFSREFPQTTAKLNKALAKSAPPKGETKKTDNILTQAEMDWLSHGLKEEIVNFIGLAKDKTFALDVAIYQYELPDIFGAIDTAFKAGVNVRLIYHAKKGDKQTAKNITAAAALPAADKYGRVTNAIFHHKFIVLSRMVNGKRVPQAVLCGSTNFTLNGVYAQANNVTITSNPIIMSKYLGQFEFLFQQPAHDPAATSIQDSEQNILDPSAAWQVGFSPRAGKVDLTFFASLIQSAKQDVLFATAFGIDPIVMNALVGQPNDSILRYGIQDKPTKNVTGIHADKTADFEAASTLPVGLEGWLDEHRMPGQLGSILIHDKIIVIDFTSDSPIVIDGSHNYSGAASQSNDENYLVIRNDTSFADCFGIEVLRLYDHYRFRFVTKEQSTVKSGAKAVKRAQIVLDSTDGWTGAYYDPTNLKFADRVIFSGTASGDGSAPTMVAARSIQQIRSNAAAAGTANAGAPAKGRMSKTGRAKRGKTKKAKTRKQSRAVARKSK